MIALNRPCPLPDAANHRRELPRLLLVFKAQQDRFDVEMKHYASATEARRLYGTLDEELLQALLVGCQETDQHALGQEQADEHKDPYSIC